MEKRPIVIIILLMQEISSVLTVSERYDHFPYPVIIRIGYINVSRSVHTNTLRRSTRSTSTPASGAKRNVGICPAKPTVPSSSDDFVNRYTSHDVATRVIHVPISEMLCPPKNNRKLRCRRARQACESPSLCGAVFSAGCGWLCFCVMP